MKMRNWIRAAAMGLGILPTAALAEEPKESQTTSSESQTTSLPSESSPEPSPESISPPYKKKQPYSFVFVGGTDTVLNAPSWYVPIARASIYKELGSSCWDVLGNVDSQAVFIQLDCRSNPGVGMKPHFDYVAHGDYRHYDGEGERIKQREIAANVLGIDAFATGSWERFLAKLTYGVGMKWYAQQEHTTITPPRAHFIQDATIELGYRNMEIKDPVLGIKEGLEAMLLGSWLTRPGYQNTEGKNYSLSSQRSVAYLGVFHDFPSRANVKTELRAGWEEGVDLQNALYLGSLVSRHAPMPGWSYMEVRHSPFAQAQASVAFPVGENYRLEPGVSAAVLFAPNKVKDAVPISSTQFHPSAFLILNGKVGGLLPIGIKYGYAPRDGLLQGTHEVMGYVALAFGKLE